MFDKIDITGGLYLLRSTNNGDDFHLCRKVLRGGSDMIPSEGYYCEGLLDKKVMSIAEAEARNDIVVTAIDKEMLLQKGIKVFTKGPSMLIEGEWEYALKKDIRDLVVDILASDQNINKKTSGEELLPPAK